MARRIERKLAVEEYDRGQIDMADIATRYGVTRKVFAGWIYTHHNRPSRITTDLQTKRRQVWEDGVDNMRSLQGGAGGRMPDKAVREATRRLERAIVAMQQRLGYQTFEYRS